jgi:hypothetical protein
MATHSPERRQHSDRRRRSDEAGDLYERLEEKRKQFDRRRTVRRESDRAAEISPQQSGHLQPSAESVATSEGRKGAD